MSLTGRSGLVAILGGILLSACSQPAPTQAGAQGVQKRYFLSADAIRPIATGLGGAFATDRITVEGARVGYMYREHPDNGIDSGWRFMAGDEGDRYMDDPANIGIFDVNTIANYDPAIIPYLKAPIGSAFRRVGDAFRATEPPTPRD
jgi:hypothetical protein